MVNASKYSFLIFGTSGWDSSPRSGANTWSLNALSSPDPGVHDEAKAKVDNVTQPRLLKSARCASSPQVFNLASNTASLSISDAMVEPNRLPRQDTSLEPKLLPWTPQLDNQLRLHSNRTVWTDPSRPKTRRARARHNEPKNYSFSGARARGAL